MKGNTIGERLRELRGNRTITEVAEDLGLTKGAISQYELGLRVPSDTVKKELARYYNVSVQELFFD